MAPPDRAPRAWLMKTEPDVFSFDDLLARPNQTEPWNGVRNYQARNWMRDDMRVGDLVLFHHSRVAPPHIVGLARIAREAYPDPTALDPASPYHDPKATPENPRWVMVDVQAVGRFPVPVTLDMIRDHPGLREMLVIRKGQRLSIQPVTPMELAIVLELGGFTLPADLAAAITMGG